MELPTSFRGDPKQRGGGDEGMLEPDPCDGIGLDQLLRTQPCDDGIHGVGVEARRLADSRDRWRGHRGLRGRAPRDRLVRAGPPARRAGRRRRPGPAAVRRGGAIGPVGRARGRSRLRPADCRPMPISSRASCGRVTVVPTRSATRWWSTPRLTGPTGRSTTVPVSRSARTSPVATPESSEAVRTVRTATTAASPTRRIANSRAAVDAGSIHWLSSMASRTAPAERRDGGVRRRRCRSCAGRAVSMRCLAASRRRGRRVAEQAGPGDRRPTTGRAGRSG